MKKFPDHGVSQFSDIPKRTYENNSQPRHIKENNHKDELEIKKSIPYVFRNSIIKGNVYFLGKYHVVWKGYRPSNWSKTILDFKGKNRQNHSDIVVKISNEIANFQKKDSVMEIIKKTGWDLTSPSIIMSIPSSKPTLFYDFSPGDYVCEKVSLLYPELTYIRHGIFRKEEIISAKKGNRDFNTHYSSLRIKQRLKYIKPKSVILFDDVFTTGTSFETCASLIFNETGCNVIHGIFAALTEKKR